MNNCYIFNNLNYKNGLFDDSIDATYILTMKNSKRINNIEKQLNRIKPTSKIILVINKGFKKCNKNLPINISNVDIIHSNLEIFKHSLKYKYNNILVLEDDFIFDDNLYDYIHIHNVNQTLNENKNNFFILSLGSLPLLTFPYNHCIHKSFISLVTQAMIYTKKSRIYILNDNPLSKRDWDYYTNTLTKHVYYLPLITQTFPPTENQNNWDNFYGLKNIAIQYIKNNELNIKPQPGFNNTYLYLKILNFLLIIIVILIIFYLLNYLKK